MYIYIYIYSFIYQGLDFLQDGLAILLHEDQHHSPSLGHAFYVFVVSI